MSLWLVRAGRHGEREQDALDKDIVTIGWDELEDLSSVSSREELEERYRESYPDAEKGRRANHVGQIWRFIHEIQVNDLVALPLKQQAAIAIGKVTGEYQYAQDGDYHHYRPVEWLKTIPRSAFDQDLLYSLGAFMTVCQISRNDAEKRVQVLLQKEEYDVAGEQPEQEEEGIDVAQYARDQIVKHIGRNFRGHDLSRLVDAVLQAQGFITQRSRPGPDGGVDILAASGGLGFAAPRICVQVKSTSQPVDVKVLRELQGVMTRVRADRGLLVSWGGFTQEALREARENFFSIRLWDSGGLLEAIFNYYDQFGDELKAELPLKRTWSLVFEDE